MDIVRKDLLFTTLGFVTAYHVCYWIVHFASLKLFKTYREMKASAQTRWIGFVLSTVNSVFCCVYAWWSFFSSGAWENYVPGWHEWAACVMLSYFIHDLLTSRPQPLSADFAHHALAMTLIVNFLALECYSRFFTAFLFLEHSTICVNLTWHLMKIGLNDSTLCSMSKWAFAVTFFFCRILWLPIPCSAMGADVRCYNDYPRGWVFIPSVCWILYGLQWFWFYKIVRQMLAQSGIAFQTERVQKVE